VGKKRLLQLKNSNSDCKKDKRYESTFVYFYNFERIFSQKMTGFN